jgi:hypothetical protein
MRRSTQGGAPSGGGKDCECSLARVSRFSPSIASHCWTGEPVPPSLAARLKPTPAGFSPFRIDRHQMPMPTTVAAFSLEGDDIAELAFTYGATTRRWTGFVFPIVDGCAGALEEVQQMSTVGACVFLHQRAQNVLLLLFDRLEISTLCRQQFRILHSVSPRRTAENLSLDLQSVTERKPNSRSHYGFARGSGTRVAEKAPFGGERVIGGQSLWLSNRRHPIFDPRW